MYDPEGLVRPRGRNRDRSAVRGDRGQSTAEIAIALPVVVLLFLAVIQLALIGRDAVLVEHVAREAARRGAVTDDRSAVVAGAGRWSALDPDRLTINLVDGAGPGDRMVMADVGYRSPTDVPIIGPLLGDVPLSATVTMRIE